MKDYPIVPGRGLATNEATELRLDYIKSHGYELESIANNLINKDQIRNNIESFIGAVEIPVGLAGPLLFNENEEKKELIHAAVGTLEGALVASMNRGAKAVSLSGGFYAAVIHQKMIRTPMFIFHSLADSIIFKNWAENNYLKIKQIAEQYSNHAVLTNILPYVTGKSVHLKFVYTTGDASGQNMTTACTWHAILWMHENFTKETGKEIVHFVIEGNGASDKKASHFSMSHGRGVHVVAECNLKEEVINKVLRTTSDDFIRCFNQSVAMSKLDGMLGYNINVANAIAAIFVATGQDLGCIHESSCGILNVEKTPDGLYLSLNLPCLVIGTVGGGTHLTKQKEALELMGCSGNGKIQRFAKLIAGFALALEVSTFAAIISGQFAKAHEKLGRNKPVNWLLRSDINKGFMKKCLNGSLANKEISAIHFPEEKLIENGIITNLTNRISKKLIGFLPVEVSYSAHKNSDIQDSDIKQTFLLKSKPLDTEVIKGLHFMAAAIQPELADLINENQSFLEYHNCHSKEITLYELLHKKALNCIPAYHGKYVDASREIYVFAQELLDYKNLEILNSENHPAKWNKVKIQSVIKTITEVHQSLSAENIYNNEDKTLKCFEPWEAKALYQKMASIISQEYEDQLEQNHLNKLAKFIDDLETEHQQLNLPKTIIHNDFNPRNIAIRKGGKVCIYDWELAVKNIPHRDVIEFLSFAFEEDFPEENFIAYLRFHFSLQLQSNSELKWESWKKGYEYAIKEYLATRVSFYLVGSILMRYEFAERIFNNSFRMLEILKSKNQD